MKFPRRPLKSPRTIELTALMDVIFILLIFFMLNSQLDKQQSISMELPQAENSRVSLHQHIEILITALNQISAQEQTMSLPKLKAWLEQQDRQRSVMIKADRDASYGKALEVFDVLQTLGYQKVSLGTVPPRL